MTTTKTNPRIAIIGAGAVGCLLGGLLANKGYPVTLVGRKEQVKTIQRQGLKITGALGRFTVNVAASTRLDFKPDFLFLTVKAHDVASTCRQIESQVKEIPVVTMQNGVSLDAQAASFFGHHYVVGCVVLFNARYLESGTVHCGFNGPLLFEERRAAEAQPVRAVCSLLEQVFSCQRVTNFSGARWTKLIINTIGNGIEAISGLSFWECSHYPILGKMAVLILREGFRVLRRRGIRVQPLPGFHLRSLKWLARLPLGPASWLLRRKWAKKGAKEVISSTLQSLKRGKETEIDYLNGEIVRLGIELALPTPVNSQVVAWVHGVEKSQTFISFEEIEKSLLKNS